MKFFGASALFALGSAFCVPSALSQEQPLSVCADPNDLPYSNSAEDGFENKIVRLIADRLHRPLVFDAIEAARIAVYSSKGARSVRVTLLRNSSPPSALRENVASRAGP
jgi:hypothetical protein